MMDSFTLTIEVDEASPSEDEAAAEAALHGNIFFQFYLQQLI